MRAVVALVLLSGTASATTLEYQVSRGDASRPFTVVITGKSVRVDAQGFLDTATATGTHVSGTSALLGGKVEFDLADREKVTQRLADAYIEQMIAAQTVGKDELRKKAHEQVRAERTKLKVPLAYKATSKRNSTPFGSCVEHTVDGGIACLLPFGTSKIEREQMEHAGQLVETSFLFDPLAAPGIPVTVKCDRYTLTLKSLK